MIKYLVASVIAITVIWFVGAPYRHQVDVMLHPTKQKGHSIQYYEKEYNCSLKLVDSNVVIVDKGWFEEGADTLVFYNYQCGNKGKQFFRLPNDSLIWVSNIK